MVEICDTYDACSSVEIASAITVVDKSFTAAELDQTAASISKALKSGNLDINLFHNVQRFYILLKNSRPIIYHCNIKFYDVKLINISC